MATLTTAVGIQESTLKDMAVIIAGENAPAKPAEGKLEAKYGFEVALISPPDPAPTPTFGETVETIDVFMMATNELQTAVAIKGALTPLIPLLTKNDVKIGRAVA